MKSLIPNYLVWLISIIGAIPIGTLLAFGIFFSSIYFVFALVFTVAFYIVNLAISKHLKKMYYEGKWKSYRK